MRRLLLVSTCVVALVTLSLTAQGRQGGAAPAGQVPAAPGTQGFVAQAGGLTAASARRPEDGLGPFKTLTIRNVMLIDGTGAPPTGPVNIVIEGNRIARVQSAGTPGLPARQGGRGAQAPGPGEHVVDGTGMYVLPGFIDMHVHAGGAPKNAEAEYAYKLWLAHGVTTVRGVPLGSNNISVSEKARSEKNEIVAPRIVNYQRPGSGWSGGAVNTPEKAREWVRWAAANGIDGLKVGAEQPDIMAPLMDEARKNHLGSTAHLQQGGVAQMNAIKAARAGLQSVTHFYGHFESLLKDYVVQPWPVDMNAADEQWRFGQVARLWNKIHEPGSPEWKAYLQEHLKLGTVFDPTLTIYSAGRDVMRFRAAE